MAASEITAKKRCEHEEGRWARCECAWHIYFRALGQPWRFSLDFELEKHIWTKADAVDEAKKIRDAVIAGTWVWRKDRGVKLAAPFTLAGATDSAVATFSALNEGYVKKVIDSDPETSEEWKQDRRTTNRMIREWGVDDQTKLGDLAPSAITETILEDLFEEYLEDYSISRRNKFVHELNGVFRWADRKGYADNPITGESTVLVGRTPIRRHVRVRQPLDEWLITAALLRVALRNGKPLAPIAELDPNPLIVTPKLYAGNRLAAIIRAAIETGCRRGELLGMRWEHIFADAETPYILIPGKQGGDPKARKSQPRKIRLTMPLAMLFVALRSDANSEPFPLWAYVFGDEAGEKVGDIGRAFDTAVLHAHGYTPGWVNGGLDAASRELLRKIDLHFHDLRHEAGHRWIEKGVPANLIQQAYGHENLETTSIYLGVPLSDVPSGFDKYEATRELPPEVALAEFGQNVHKTCTKGPFVALAEAGGRNAKDGKLRLVK